MTGGAAKPNFPNLDALRFIAASAVICAHCWMHIDTGADTQPWIKIFKHYAQLGVWGVNFFFVLSGFLITYLMLNEMESTGAFSLRRYFMRRILRIWPLFFLVLIIGFILTPIFKTAILHQVYFETAHPLWYVLFINNYHHLFYGQPVSPSLGSLWTIAVEEQFYVLFPLIIFVPKKMRLLFPIGVLLFSILFRAYFVTNGPILYYHTFSVMGDFAVGALLAYFCFKRSGVFQKLVNIPGVAIAALYACIILFIAFDFSLFNSGLPLVFERLLLAILFAAVIFEQVFCTNSLFKPGRSSLLSYGGKISYGMYCYQYIAIIPVYNLLSRLTIYNRPVVFTFIHPLLTIAVSFIIASVSYRYFESYFLRLKKYFYPV